MADDWDGIKERRIHDCLKEKEWGILQGKLDNIAACNKRIEEKQITIMSELFGNGKEGLHTQVALCNSSLSRVWIWLSAISVAILGVSVGVPWYVTRLVVSHVLGAE